MLSAGNIWHSAVKAQTRTDRHANVVQVLGVNLTVSNAGSPYLRATDTTNTVHTQIQSGDTDGFVGTISDHRLQFVTNNATEMVIMAAGNIGIGTTAPAAGLHGVVSTGAFLWADSEADSTNKVGRWGVEHYLVAEEYFYGIVHSATSSTNVLDLGGGVSQGNAATSIRFWTAANYNTTTGTERMRIESGGRLLVTDAAGIGFLGDADTYIYQIGADELNFFVGGALDYSFSTTKLDLIGNYLEMNEIASPGGAVNQARLFTRDNGGTTEVCFVFDGGDLVCHADPIP